MDEDAERVSRFECRCDVGRRPRLRRGRGEPVADQRDLETHPGGDEDDGGDGRSRGVHDVGQLLARHVHAIRDRPHRVADDQRVGVVVEEDREAAEVGRELGPPRGRGERPDRLHDPTRAATLADDAHHSAEQEREHQDRRVVRIHQGGRDERVDRPQRPGDRIEAGVEEGAEPDAQKQRRHDFLEHQGEHDGENRWQQADPPGEHTGVERADRRVPPADHGEREVVRALDLQAGKLEPPAFPHRHVPARDDAAGLRADPDSAHRLAGRRFDSNVEARPWQDDPRSFDRDQRGVGPGLLGRRREGAAQAVQDQASQTRDPTS